MKQVVYAGERRFEVRDHERAAPQSGEVLIEVSHTGLCGTDLHIFDGDMDQRVSIPAVIGHEMSGRVREAGPGVTGWPVGTPVTVLPTVSCGQCPACRAGHTHICHQLNFLGIDSTGSLQQCWSVPAQSLIALPERLPLTAAALVEPTAVAVHDVGRSQVQPGEHVVVVGGGPVGILIALVARHAGAIVAVVEPNGFRRQMADALQLATVDPGSVDVTGWVDDWTGGAGAAVSFEVSGSAEGVTSAVDVLATRGRLCLVAIHTRPREINLHRFFWRELTLCGARLYERGDFTRAIELISDGVIPADTLISRIVVPGDVAGAFAALRSGGEVMKVLVDCQAF